MPSKAKVAVLMGGRSLEREVSLKSGTRVAIALRHKNYEVKEIDVDEQLIEELQAFAPDIAYIALHGKYGEDGSIQEVLDILKIPYTGAGVYANILGMDKVLTKHLLTQNDIPTPGFHALSSGAFKDMGASKTLPSIIKELSLPMVVKPSAQGSALGLKIVHSAGDLSSALLAALSYDDKVLLEEHIKGTEIAAAIIGNENPQVFPLVEIIPHKDWFDFESRYVMGMSDYYAPARIDKVAEKLIKEIGLKMYSLFKCRGLARVDIILRDGVPYVLELNTSPGMTETSLFPMAAKAGGIEFEDLVEKIVQLGLSV